MLKNDVIQVQLDNLTYLIPTCNSRFLVPDKYGKLIFRATNYRKSEENIKHVLIYLPNNFSKPCIKCLEKLGLDTPIRNKYNKIVYFKSNLDYFHPKNILRLGSMEIITFHHVKKGSLLHVDQYRIYNV